MRPLLLDGMIRKRLPDLPGKDQNFLASRLQQSHNKQGWFE
jgi:hypothetical protein